MKGYYFRKFLLIFCDYSKNAADLSGYKRPE